MYHPSQTPASSTSNLLPPAQQLPPLPFQQRRQPSARSAQAARYDGPRPTPASSLPRRQDNRSIRSVGSDNSSQQHLLAPSSMGHTAVSTAPSISAKFSLNADPNLWGADLSPNHPEPDDYLHNPDPRRDRKNDRGGTVFTSRGFANLGCLILLCTGLVLLFAGYPMIVYFTKHPLSTLGGFNLGGINASGQVPKIETGNWGLIDLDTPQSALHILSDEDGTTWDLVFSDEFNTPNRTFYPGDDPYWEAVDLHYWQTNNLEWYDPSAIITENGYLKITFSKENPATNHNLNYRGGMVTTWNKFCFTGGKILVNVSLPGLPNVPGFWPAVWTMGNLGRAGYGASLEGMWPYSYDSCDVGTLPNQTLNGQPVAATINGDPSNGDALSYLPGQRLSACTCPGESHPGPKKKDGTFTGRSAPEIDIFEATVDGTQGQVSQSCQWAPFNNEYKFLNTSDTYTIYNAADTILNPYRGGAFQQATSGLSFTNQQCYVDGGGCYAVYGYEYKPGDAAAGGYITWINNNTPAWTVRAAGMGPDAIVQIGERPVPQEPMYILVNLGMSPNFGAIDFNDLTFPTSMRVDWIRVYQPPNAKNIGCDPPAFPTQDYINTFIDAYTNPNLTIWRDAGQTFPKNRLIDTC